MNTHIRHDPGHDEDQSELIGLSEINFLLVVALIALATGAAPAAPETPDGPDAPSVEIVRLDSVPAKQGPADEGSATGGGTPFPTHRLEGDPAPGDTPVIIAVPEGFPLEMVQFLIERSP